MEQSAKKLKRLQEKINILESMIEDRSRLAYFESTRRSAVNALLELSLAAEDIDDFLPQALDILLSASPLSVNNRGALFLFDEKGTQLSLHSHSNLAEAHLEGIRRLPLSSEFAEMILSLRHVRHLEQSDNSFFSHPPEMQPHGHYFIPIRTGSRNYGLIILFTSINTPATREDLEFLTSIGDISAGTIERVNYSRQLHIYQQNLEAQVEEQTRKLSQEKERLAVTLRSIGDGVIATDLSGNILLVNRVAEQLTGWKQQTAVGRPVQDIFHIVNEHTGVTAENPVEKVLSNGVVVGAAHDRVLLSRDGSSYIIEESGAPIFDRESKMIGAVLVFRDVTAERNIAEELLKVKKLESVGVLAGGIAHDFNNILAAILGNIELAEIFIDPDSNALPRLQEAQKAALRARDLTHQLLTFSKGGDPVKQAVQVSEIIKDSAGFVLHGSSSVCVFEIPEDLWLTEIDPGQIGQVIQNLAINAQHAMPEGGKIHISCANIADIQSEKVQAELPEKKYIRIKVQDFGTGIAPRNLVNIFDPYFTTKETGSGLGLTICHSIIKKHQGTIEVQSRQGEGTIFTIYLPAIGAGVPLPHSPADIRFPPRKATVLVMDDEIPVQEAAREMLGFLGHEVLLAGSGRETVALFKEMTNQGKTVDLVILDLTIPGGMGGKDALQELVKIDPGVKVVVSSGYSNDPVMANFRNYGFRAALSKPFLMEELKKTLGEVLPAGDENTP